MGVGRWQFGICSGLTGNIRSTSGSLYVTQYSARERSVFYVHSLRFTLSNHALYLNAWSCV